MINRFCRHATKTRTFLCLKYFLSGYFEYQVHLSIYQNAKVYAHGQTMYSRINSPCNISVVIEVKPIFSTHFEHLLSIDNTRLHQIWLKLDLLRCNILPYQLSLSLQVLSQPHHHCKSSAAHLLSSSRSLDYWWIKGRGGTGTIEASL